MNFFLRLTQKNGKGIRKYSLIIFDINLNILERVCVSRFYSASFSSIGISYCNLFISNSLLILKLIFKDKEN